MEKSKNKISVLRAFLGDLRHLRSKWTIAPFAALIVACGLAVGSCGQIKYVPVETTEVHYVDSTILHIKDSVRITERSRWKDYGGLLDTLKIRGNRSEMRAWTDTTNNILNGSLEEDPIEEHSKVIYKDRWKVRDSLVYVEKPIPVEITKEVRIVSRFWRVTGIFGIVCLVLLLTFAGWKVYGFFNGKDILKFLKKNV